MSNNRCIAAYTPMTPDVGLVSYINVSHFDEDDFYRVTVRTEGTGVSAFIDLDRAEMAAILTKLLFEMDDKLFSLIDPEVLKRVAGPRG